MSIFAFGSKIKRKNIVQHLSITVEAGSPPPPRKRKTAAGDTSCLLMMLNVFKSTMSNFLSFWKDSWDGKIFSPFLHWLSFFSIQCWSGTHVLADDNHRSVHLRSWTKSAKPCSVRTSSIPVVSVLFSEYCFATQKHVSYEFSFHLGSQGAISQHLGWLAAQGCAEW